MLTCDDAVDAFSAWAVCAGDVQNIALLGDHFFVGFLECCDNRNGGGVESFGWNFV